LGADSAPKEVSAALGRQEATGDGSDLDRRTRRTGDRWLPAG